MKFLVFGLIALAAISCTKQKNNAMKAQGAPPTAVSPNCGAIDMSPSDSLTPTSIVNFEVIPPTGVNFENLQWTFAKDQTIVHTANSQTVSRAFPTVGAYVASVKFNKPDGNPCELERAFQILNGTTCAKPSGISGPNIGYVNEETSPFLVGAEPCFLGSIAWDMENDGTIEFNTQPGQFVTYKYSQLGVYTVKAMVIDSTQDEQYALLKEIEIRGKNCVNPFTGAAVPNGESVEFAKPSTQCGGNVCERALRICVDGAFSTDNNLGLFNQDPAQCKVSDPCPATYAWEASEFGKCTGSCGSEQGTKPITNYSCKKTYNGTMTIAPDAECVSVIGAKPSGQTVSCLVNEEDQSLNCLSCGNVPHGGSVTKWASSATCGTACTSQSRTCANGNLPAFDTGYTYDSQNSCPVTECPPVYTYSWNVGSYGSCSAIACGTQGVQTRPVTCVRNDGVNVADSFCPTPKPATTQSCSAPACPVYTYSWVVGEFGACSATQCGTQGVQTRSVTCVRNDGVSVIDGFCTTAKPATTQSCSAADCPSTAMKGSTCHAFMGTMITWKDSKTGAKCVGNLFGNLMVGDYMQIGGTHYTPGNNQIKPWDKATHRGHAKIVCDSKPGDFGLLPFKVESGTCEEKPHEPDLIETPILNATTPSDCSASPVAQQAFGGGECAVYRQGFAGDMPVKGLVVQTGAKKYQSMGEFTRSSEHLFEEGKGNVFTSSSLSITYKGETKTLDAYCGDNDKIAPTNSTCSATGKVTIGGVTFTMGIGAKNIIDPKAYAPDYIGSYKNFSKRQVWSQNTCGVVTVSSSLGYLPPPCP